MIRISYDDYNTFDDSYAHIYYNKPFSYYKLRFDYRFLGDQVSGGESWNIRNSGIMLHSQSARSNDFGQFFPVSIEIQLLGGLGKEMRTTGNLCTPGTAVEIDGMINYRHCIKSTSATPLLAQYCLTLLDSDAIVFLLKMLSKNLDYL